MKKYRFLWILICLCVLLAAGCKSEDPIQTTTLPTAPATTAPTSTPETTAPPDAREVYHQFTEQMPENIAMDVTVTYEIDVAGFSFSSSSQQQITYLGRNTENFCAKVEESFVSDEFTADYSEVFCDGTVYTELGEQRFAAEMTAEDYVSGYVPAVLLDDSLYETVTIDGDTITFADATALEGWLLDEEAEIVEAGGTVTVAGNSICASYHATYQVGGNTVTVTVQQNFLSSAGTVEKPADPDSYLRTESVDGINEENSAYVARIFEAIPKIAAGEGLTNGYRVITNCGEDGCQSVKHLHFHILGGKKLPEQMA